MSLLVVSYNFDKNVDGEKLEESCVRFGYGFKWIGVGKGFVNFRQAKIDLLLEELGKINHEYVVFTDGLDSWFLKPNILKIYKKMTDKVVVSGNRDHYPVTDLYRLDEIPESPTSFRFICCSQFIGKTKDVINIIRIIRDSWSGFTDQEGWHYCLAKGLIDIEIDYYCKLFLNMTKVKMNELTKDFRLKETKFKPASVHFGGPKGGDENYTNMNNFYRVTK